MDDFCQIKNDECIHATEEDGEIYCGHQKGENRIRLMEECPWPKEREKQKKREK